VPALKNRHREKGNTVVNTQDRRTQTGLFRRWVAANTIGLGAAMAIFAAIAEGVEQSGVLGSEAAGEIGGHLLGLAIAGALFGLAQARPLGVPAARAGRAMLAGALGLWIGYVAGYELGGFPFDYILGPAAAAVLAGVAQRALLRQHGVGVAVWVGASAGGYMLGSLPGLALAFLGLGEAIGATIGGWAVLNGLMGGIAGAVGGAITGAVVVRRLRWASARPAIDSLAAGPQ
jgi:hypothetical protein